MTTKEKGLWPSALQPPSTASQRELLGPGPCGCPLPASRWGQDTKRPPTVSPALLSSIHRHCVDSAVSSAQGFALPPSDHREQPIHPSCLCFPSHLWRILVFSFALQASWKKDSVLAFVSIFSRTRTPNLRGLFCMLLGHLHLHPT